MQKGDNEVEVRQVSFATALKKMAANLVAGGDLVSGGVGLGLPVGVADELWRLGRELTVQDLKKKTPRGRKFLQFLGTEAMRRNVDDLYWVKRAAEAVRALSKETQVVFLPDTRFPNEADFIRNELGGEVWRIERYTDLTMVNGQDGPMEMPYDNGMSPEAKAHVSETALDDYKFDVVLKATNMDDLFHGVEAELKFRGLI
jgi:hypothetical protein